MSDGEPQVSGRGSAGPAEVLHPGDVHVWWTRVSAGDIRSRSHWLQWLPLEERDRCQRFAFQRDRALFLTAHALLRAALSHYLGGPPAQWQFTAGPHGKPALANGDPQTPWPTPAADFPATPSGLVRPPESPLAERLQFNLTHCKDFAACAVCLDEPVGVDAEPLERRTNLEIADRFFAPTEVAQLRKQPEPRQPLMFLRFWTLKEAYIKARGMGLALPLEKFAFQLDANQPVGIEMAPDLDDTPADWRFFQTLIDARFMLAVALRLDQPPAVRLIRWSPPATPPRGCEDDIG